MCLHSQPTKIMFVDTKYKNGKQLLYEQTLQVPIRLADHLVDEFIPDFFEITNDYKISKLTDVVGKFLMFLVCCNCLTALSHTNNIGGSGCEDIGVA